MGLSALQKAGPTRSGRPHIPRPTLHITGKLLGICSVCWMCTSHGYGVLGGHRHHEFPKEFQGHERERKLERSLLSARNSLDVVCLREREISSKVGRSLGSFDMHCLPSLHPC